MLSLTRKTDYALVALASLAREMETTGKPASAREIAGKYGLPLPLLMNVLKHLRRAGLICSTRGVQGGYRLVDGPEQITVAQVIAAIDGPVKMANCCSEELHVSAVPCGCQVEPTCPITEPIRRLNHRFAQFLSHVTLGDLMSEAQPVQSQGFVTLGIEETRP